MTTCKRCGTSVHRNRVKKNKVWGKICRTCYKTFQKKIGRTA